MVRTASGSAPRARRGRLRSAPLAALLAATFLAGCAGPVAAPPFPDPGAGVAVDVRAADLYPFGCADDEATVAASGAPRVAIGGSAVYIGARQVSGNNQDPRLVRFDDGVRIWCRDDLETSGDDGRGYGLLWAGGDALYAVFSATGTQGSADGDFRRFAREGWLRSYADASSGGGGAKVAIVARIDPATGTPDVATYLTSRLSSGRVNSLTVTDLAWNGAELRVRADAFYSPRGTDRQPLACSGDSPFDYRLTLTADLGAALAASAERCTP